MPLLKRTVSAKSALKPPPSPVLVEKGNVLQKRKVPAGSCVGRAGLRGAGFHHHVRTAKGSPPVLAPLQEWEMKSAM